MENDLWLVVVLFVLSRMKRMHFELYSARAFGCELSAWGTIWPAIGPVARRSGVLRDW